MELNQNLVKFLARHQAIHNFWRDQRQKQANGQQNGKTGENRLFTPGMTSADKKIEP
jgi:hypothetical protein